MTTRQMKVFCSMINPATGKRWRYRPRGDCNGCLYHDPTVDSHTEYGCDF